MVKYGKSLLQCRRSGWHPAYLDYKKLKKIVAELERYLEEQNTNHLLRSVSSIVAFDNSELLDLEFHDLEGDGKDLERSSFLQHEVSPAPAELDNRLNNGMDHIKERFIRELGREIEKMSLFAINFQGKLADFMGALRFEKDGSIAVLFSKNEDFFHDTQHLSNDTRDSLDFYLLLGVELLYLLQYIGVNTLGVRKILKKYNKAVQTLDDPQQLYYLGRKHDIHLQQLANSQSVVAIEASLQSALIQSYYTDQTVDNNPCRNLNYFRLQTMIQACHILRKESEIVSHPFNDFLGRKAMINLGDIDGPAKRAVNHLLSFDPKALMSSDVKTLEELWTEWLPQFKHWKHRQTLLSQTDDRSGLNQPTRDVMAFLQAQEEDFYFLSKRPEDASTILKKSWGGVDMLGMVLNLLSILLYTINYYIVAPTANHYALLLGQDGAYGATLIGASSLAAIFAAFLYSFWYNKATFRSALIFSAICPLVGNLVYALAISYESMGMALGGRILCGFGSAEVLNRQLISTCVSFKQMTRASALFVAFGASGMSIGPLIAAILDSTAGRDVRVDVHLPFTPAGGIIYNHVTSPAFVMAGLWFAQMLAMIIFFKEPDRINVCEEIEMQIVEGDDDSVDEANIPQPNQYGSISSKRLSTGESTHSTASEESFLKQVKSSGFIQELTLTWALFMRSPGLTVTLLVFCFIELADEVLISSCSMIVRRYFGWHGSAAGFLIAALGALVLPANFVVEIFSRRVSERRILRASLWVILLGCFGILNYQGMYYDLLGVSTYGDLDPVNTTHLASLELGGESVGHILTSHHEFPYDWNYGPAIYITFLCIIFMGTIVLEGVNTSIMAQVTPPQLNSCFFNAGLLATLIGTLGRVLSDLLITLSALLDIHVFVDFVNATFVPLILLTLACLLLVTVCYSKLV
jgi:MFS family permease